MLLPECKRRWRSQNANVGLVIRQCGVLGHRGGGSIGEESSSSVVRCVGALGLDSVGPRSRRTNIIFTVRWPEPAAHSQPAFRVRNELWAQRTVCWRLVKRASSGVRTITPSEWLAHRDKIVKEKIILKKLFISFATVNICNYGK